jgi:hypothetical protein
MSSLDRSPAAIISPTKSNQRYGFAITDRARVSEFVGVRLPCENSLNMLNWTLDLPHLQRCGAVELECPN